jgi:hypothetical protein
MTGKSPQTSLTKPRPKRAPRLRNRSARAGASLDAASVEVVVALGLAPTSKPNKWPKLAKKTPNVQGDAGVAPNVPVPVISKHQSDGFAVKKMPDDPAWIALWHDLDNMSKMQLRAKYEGEANNHRNMKQRVKTCGAVVHPDFRIFKDFLRLVGPKPTKKATVDRINNDDPEYAPGKVRWADKATQNSNKGDSLIFTCLTTGRSYTASQLAAKQGATPTAIRKRRKQGWTDTEIIAGHRNKLVPVPSVVPIHGKGSIPAKQKATKQILFERNRESIEHDRQAYGVEPFVMTPRELQDLLQDDFPEYRGAVWLEEEERKFLKSKLPRYWKDFGPHINFAALRPDQQEWVLRIDPTQRQKLELAEQL